MPLGGRSISWSVERSARPSPGRSAPLCSDALRLGVHPGVNAAVEAVWASRERELACIHGRQTWSTRDLLRSAIFDDVEGFCNPQRTRKRLGYLSPADSEETQVA